MLQSCKANIISNRGVAATAPALASRFDAESQRYATNMTGSGGYNNFNSLCQTILKRPATRDDRDRANRLGNAAAIRHALSEGDVCIIHYIILCKYLSLSFVICFHGRAKRKTRGHSVAEFEVFDFYVMSRYSPTPSVVNLQ